MMPTQKTLHQSRSLHCDGQPVAVGEGTTPLIAGAGKRIVLATVVEGIQALLSAFELPGAVDAQDGMLAEPEAPELPDEPVPEVHTGEVAPVEPVPTGDESVPPGVEAPGVDALGVEAPGV
jgi:hypothetical protein